MYYHMYCLGLLFKCILIQSAHPINGAAAAGIRFSGCPSIVSACVRRVQVGAFSDWLAVNFYLFPVFMFYVSLTVSVVVFFSVTFY